VTTSGGAGAARASLTRSRRTFRFLRGAVRDGFDRGAVGGEVGGNPSRFGGAYGRS
jgi:hypothetical protein